MNNEWHTQHPLSDRATLDERVEWHRDHAEQCNCRDMPDSIRSELEYRGITVPPKLDPAP